MFAGLPSLTHEQQQKAVERIHSGERIVARFEDEDE